MADCVDVALWDSFFFFNNMYQLSWLEGWGLTGRFVGCTSDCAASRKCLRRSGSVSDRPEAAEQLKSETHCRSFTGLLNPPQCLSTSHFSIRSRRPDERQSLCGPAVCVFRWEGFIMLISQEPHFSSVRPFVGSFLFSHLHINLQPNTKTYGSTNDPAAPFRARNTCYFSVLIPHLL